MLQQASVEQIRQQQIPRINTRLVIAMCYYPRGLKKKFSDDFRNILAPDRNLFKEWKEQEKIAGHEKAFIETDYENRFYLSPIALYMLKSYTEESVATNKDIFFICQCEMGQRCHREILLLTAAKKYGANIGPLYHQYPTYEQRILQMDDTIKLW